MIGLGWCGLCGTTLTEEGARRCGCAPQSELAIVTARVVSLCSRSGAGFDPRSIKRALRFASAERREERGLPRRRRAS